jgi:hypothetical protein
MVPQADASSDRLFLWRTFRGMCDLEINADKLKSLIREKTREFRQALDEQYQCIFNDI